MYIRKIDEDNYKIIANCKKCQLRYNCIFDSVKCTGSMKIQDGTDIKFKYRIRVQEKDATNLLHLLNKQLSKIKLSDSRKVFAS